MTEHRGESESFSTIGANIFGSPRWPNGRGSGLKLRTVWVQIPPGARQTIGDVCGHFCVHTSPILFIRLFVSFIRFVYSFRLFGEIALGRIAAWVGG